MLFDLGVARGTPVTSISYGYTLSSAYQHSMPVGSMTAGVGNDEDILYSGLRGMSAGELKAPGAPSAGAGLIGISAGARGFPNQECNRNECVPAAVANSLQYLNTKYDLGIPNSEITIDKMKLATGWAADGCWTYNENGHTAWWQDKDAYMKAHSLGITTTQIGFGSTEQSRRAAMAEVMRQRDAGQDVEILWNGHAVALVGVVELDDGWYKLYVNHDRRQGKDGGCVTEPVAYDPVTGRLVRASRTDLELLYAVVECPEPGSLALLGLGTVIVLLRRIRMPNRLWRNSR